MGEKVLHLSVAEGGERVDRYLARERPELSRSQIQRLIKDGFVTLAGIIPKPSAIISHGDRILLRIPPPSPSTLAAQPLPLEILYEDQDLLVINKPGGMVVHPGAGHRGGTLANALLARYPHLVGQDPLRPGIVHRLDKGTSGLMVAAKNERAQRLLQEQFRQGKVKKIYLALVEGHPRQRQGVIEAAIGRDPRNRKRMAVVRRGGREATTEYKVLEQIGDYALVEARPRTGRTHQVRVHLASIGHPLVGDALYSRRWACNLLPRQFLHSQVIGFLSPTGGEYLEFRAELPRDLQGFLDELRREVASSLGRKTTRIKDK